MLLAARDVVAGIEWVKASKDNADIAKAAEKEKKYNKLIKTNSSSKN